MGNSNSHHKKSETDSNTDADSNSLKFQNLPPKDSPLYESIDYIATKYILTLDFESLLKLNEKSYCESLIVLTSDIIDNKMNSLDIGNVANRIEHGSSSVEQNQNQLPRPTPNKNKFTFFKKSDIDNMDIPDFKKKQETCDKIAKFYVKIAHIFSAIVQTINPTYSYTDFWGNNIKLSLSEKDKLPSGKKQTVEQLNLCQNRVDILKAQEGKLGSNADTKKDYPDLCSINLLKNGKIKSLENEPGIPELKQLYYDKYNYKTGKYHEMSENALKQFNIDLEHFYKSFTGDEGKMPAEIVNFSDIKLRNHKLELSECSTKNKTKDSLNKESESESGPIGSYDKSYLLTEYANNLNQMIISMNENHQKLLLVINTIFLKTEDKDNGKDKGKDVSTVIRINPELTEQMLQSIIEKVRTIIIELYVKCEEDFVKGLQLYEAIVNVQILDTTHKQIEQLGLEKDKLIRG